VPHDEVQLLQAPAPAVLLYVPLAQGLHVGLDDPPHEPTSSKPAAHVVVQLRQMRSTSALGTLGLYCNDVHCVHAVHAVLLLPLQPPVLYEPNAHVAHTVHTPFWLK